MIPFLEGEDESFYEWPEEFKSDWLNEFTIATGRQDYRFVYIGPKDSHTGFHQDVLVDYWLNLKTHFISPYLEQTKYQPNGHSMGC